MFDLKENEDGFYFMSNRGKRGNDDDVEDTNEFHQQPICLVTATDVLYKDGWHNLEKIYNEFSAGDQEHFYHHPIRLKQTQSKNSQLLVSIFSLQSGDKGNLKDKAIKIYPIWAFIKHRIQN